jgi:hypothetical protein
LGAATNVRMGAAPEGMSTYSVATTIRVVVPLQSQRA